MFSWGVSGKPKRAGHDKCIFTMHFCRAAKVDGGSQGQGWAFSQPFVASARWEQRSKEPNPTRAENSLEPQLVAVDGLFLSLLLNPRRDAGFCHSCCHGIKNRLRSGEVAHAEMIQPNTILGCGEA